MLRYLIRSFGMIYKIKKSWIIITLFFRIINGLIPLVELWIIQSIINQVSAYISNDGELINVIGLILLQFAIMIIKSSISEYMNIKDIEMQQTLDYHIGTIIMNKLMSVPYHYYEIPSFYNHHYRIKNNYGSRFLRPVTNTLEALQTIISIFAYIGFLFTAHWALVIIGIAVAIPTFLIQYKYGGFKFNLLKAQSGKLREANYIHGLIGNKQSAKEIRLFSLGSTLIDKWGKIILSNNAKTLNILDGQKRANIRLDMFAALLYASGALLTIYIIKTSKISIGKFVTVIQSLKELQQSVNNASYLLAVILESNLYIKDFFEFIDYKDEHSEEKIKSNLNKGKVLKDIDIKNLYYKYPMGEKYALEDISFTINANEKIAIVGDNGSGKSTLIKILIGLYSPTNGRVFFGDKEIKEISDDDLKNNITVIFQDFVKFAYSVKENIAFSSFKDIKDVAKIKRIARITGIDKLVEKLPDSYNTNLGKIHPNGVDISGGEWQKIALSRALFKNSNIIILDEPTASLDPKTELYIFNKFVEIAKEKTAIFISHRMAAAKIADRIIVMSNGKIVEEGKHDELMIKKGIYYNMYKSQLTWYEESEKTLTGI